METIEPFFVTTKKASKVVNLSAHTLEKLRSTGGGPTFVKLGNSVRYELIDLLQWMRNRKIQSTSEVSSKIRGNRYKHLNAARNKALSQRRASMTLP